MTLHLPFTPSEAGVRADSVRSVAHVGKSFSASEPRQAMH